MAKKPTRKAVEVRYDARAQKYYVRDEKGIHHVFDEKEAMLTFLRDNIVWGT